MTEFDPKIKLSDAIAKAGNQSELAKALGIHRVNITDWKKAKLDYLPPLHAYRFREMRAADYADLFPLFDGGQH